VDFRQLRYALSVYKERSFTKAAKRLNISQSAVSEQVKLLEEETALSCSAVPRAASNPQTAAAPSCTSPNA
jgi:transposase